MEGMGPDDERARVASLIAAEGTGSGCAVEGEQAAGVWVVGGCELSGGGRLELLLGWMTARLLLMDPRPCCGALPWCVDARFGGVGGAAAAAAAAAVAAAVAAAGMLDPKRRACFGAGDAAAAAAAGMVLGVHYVARLLQGKEHYVVHLARCIMLYIACCIMGACCRATDEAGGQEKLSAGNAQWSGFVQYVRLLQGN
eukprot:scaffold79632_cov19-Tisochrysis_lutea.AAC.1